MPEGWFLDALGEKYRQGAQRADAATLAARSDAMRAKALSGLTAAQEADLRQKTAWAAESRDLDTWNAANKGVSTQTAFNNANAIDRLTAEGTRLDNAKKLKELSTNSFMLPAPDISALSGPTYRGGLGLGLVSGNTSGGQVPSEVKTVDASGRQRQFASLTPIYDKWLARRAGMTSEPETEAQRLVKGLWGLA